MTRNDVLIIGAGPSGLFAAAELARHGVQARLIEREVQPHREARATAIQPGTLEILDTVGLLPPFLEAAEHIHCARMYGPDMSELGAMSHDGIDCCCEFQCSLPQYETQRILEAHLASLGGAVERGVTATKVETDADGVSSNSLHADGKVETVRPTVVIGAGGAHSVTRHSMSEPLEGTTYRGHFLVADIAMPAPFPRDEAGVICGPNGLLLLAPLPGGRWISFQDLEEDVENVSADEVVTRVEARLGGKYRPTDVAWFAPFRMHRRIVSRLADGQRFLIGDAAHLSSPFGGEGLNAGLHDGYDLAWKLALVLRGHASSVAARRLHDGAPDRRPPRTGRLRPGAPFDRRVRRRRPSAPRDSRRGRRPDRGRPRAQLARHDRRRLLRAARSSSTMAEARQAPKDRVPGSGIPTGRSSAERRTTCWFSEPSPTPSRSRSFAERWSKLVEISHNPSVDPAPRRPPGGGVVMIRPDGHIGFRFPSAEADAFTALDRHLSSYLIPDQRRFRSKRRLAENV